MEPVGYQTITLSQGKHGSPEDGVCVVELASILAGEPFTDHPQSVCPVIGAFLRAYNDGSTTGAGRTCTPTRPRWSAAVPHRASSTPAPSA